MSSVLAFLMPLAALAVLASLLGGLVILARGRPGDAQRSNRLMQWRVMLQAFALLMFLLVILIGG